MEQVYKIESNTHSRNMIIFLVQRKIKQIYASSMEKAFHWFIDTFMFGKLKFRETSFINNVKKIITSLY